MLLRDAATSSNTPLDSSVSTRPFASRPHHSLTTWEEFRRAGSARIITSLPDVDFRSMPWKLRSEKTSAALRPGAIASFSSAMRAKLPRSVWLANSFILRLSSRSTTTVLMATVGGVCCARAELTRSTRNVRESLIMAGASYEERSSWARLV